MLFADVVLVDKIRDAVNVKLEMERHKLDSKGLNNKWNVIP